MLVISVFRTEYWVWAVIDSLFVFFPLHLAIYICALINNIKWYSLSLHVCVVDNGEWKIWKLVKICMYISAIYFWSPPAETETEEEWGKELKTHGKIKEHNGRHLFSWCVPFTLSMPIQLPRDRRIYLYSPQRSPPSKLNLLSKRALFQSYIESSFVPPQKEQRSAQLEEQIVLHTVGLHAHIPPPPTPTPGPSFP